MKFYKGAFMSVGKMAAITRGYSKWCFITLSEEHKDSPETIEHEVKHVHQFWIGLVVPILIAVATLPFIGTEYLYHALIYGFAVGFNFHSMAYKFSDKYRFWAEVQAFKESVKHGRDVDDAALSISQNYDLKVTPQEAKEALLK